MIASAMTSQPNHLGKASEGAKRKEPAHKMMKAMLERRRRAEGDGGFTLIELLVVIVILAILTAFVVFAVGGFQD